MYNNIFLIQFYFIYKTYTIKMGIFQSKTNSDLPPQERISTVKQLVDDVANIF